MPEVPASHQLDDRVLVQAVVIGVLGEGTFFRVHVPNAGGLVPVVVPAAGVRAASDPCPF